MVKNYDFKRYLDITLEITRAMTLDQIEKQWERMMNYEYRIKKIRQFVNWTFVTALIFGPPLVLYNELNSFLRENKEIIELKSSPLEGKTEKN